MGRRDATDAEVEAAAQAAGCGSFIAGLEHGFDTMVGGAGAHLSGGERQRIAIARAMLKNAPIIVLDEATAYIDPENEAVIQKAVARLVADKTVTDIEAVCMILARAEYLVLPQRTRPKKQVEGRQELSALYGNSACCNDN